MPKLEWEPPDAQHRTTHLIESASLVTQVHKKRESSSGRGTANGKTTVECRLAKNLISIEVVCLVCSGEQRGHPCPCQPESVNQASEEPGGQAARQERPI